MGTEVSGPHFRSVGIRDVVFGDDVTVVEPVNLYGCGIGDGSFIGPFTEVQSGVTIGKGCLIQSHTLVCEYVEIGDGCVIAHGVMFINDRFREGPARGDRSKWEPTRVGNRVSIGSNATILPVSICDDVVVGAGAVVVRNINEPGRYAGNPARRLN